MLRFIYLTSSFIIFTLNDEKLIIRLRLRNEPTLTRSQYPGLNISSTQRSLHFPSGLANGVLLRSKVIRETHFSCFSCQALGHEKSCALIYRAWINQHSLGEKKVQIEQISDELDRTDKCVEVIIPKVMFQMNTSIKKRKCYHLFPIYYTFYSFLS